MDFFFNKFIPTSTYSRIVQRPAAKSFINGMSPSYSANFSPMLSNYMTDDEFEYIMHTINETAAGHFPCIFCFVFGYILALFTFGLSLFCPYMCIKDAEEQTRNRIYQFNKGILKSRSVIMSLEFGCSTSWVIIIYIYIYNRIIF